MFLVFKRVQCRKEANYLNKLMEVYILSGLEEKNQTAINTVEFIDQQLGIIDDSLQLRRWNCRVSDWKTVWSDVYH